MKKLRIPTVKEVKEFKGSFGDFKNLITIEPSDYEMEYYHYQERVLNALASCATFHPERNFLHMTIRLISAPAPFTDLLHELAKNGFTYKITNTYENKVSLKISW